MLSILCPAFLLSPNLFLLSLFNVLINCPYKNILCYHKVCFIVFNARMCHLFLNIIVSIIRNSLFAIRYQTQIRSIYLTPQNHNQFFVHSDAPQKGVQRSASNCDHHRKSSLRRACHKSIGKLVIFKYVNKKFKFAGTSKSLSLSASQHYRLYRTYTNVKYFTKITSVAV